ncbi:MAG: hypothetical protein H7A51_09070 [Akkermansiaceae bacterium]|nr:hypothetical protein [Akkermansiaceae bacterium]
MKSVPIHFISKYLVLSSLVLSGLLNSCSSTDVMEVRQYHLSSVNPVHKDARMIRGEQMYRLRGAVTLEERQARLGQYYTVIWKNPTASTEPLRIIMDYQQTATGSKPLRMMRDLPGNQSSGRCEFNVTSEAYRVGGRVLSWRIRMMQGDRVLAEKRSYLWR